jgi:RimJ/RimL family protein N-acetyltransferase
MTPATALTAPPKIETERLVLRPIIDADVDALHAMLSDAETMRYWSTLPHTERQQTIDWVAGNRAAMAAGTALEYGAVYQGKLIGRATFWNGNEIGFLFDRAYWGQGFASECLTAMIDFAFQCRDWTEIIADVDPRNLASWKVLERLGFQRTGFELNTFCIGGLWSDSQYLALGREVWLVLQQQRASQ